MHICTGHNRGGSVRWQSVRRFGRFGGLLLGGLALPAMSDGAVVAVPSGQPVRLQDVITDRPGWGLTYRFRFVAPDIASQNGVVEFALVQADMIWLCDNYALPRIASTGPQPSQIVISLSDSPTDFGAAAPNVTQFFEGYSIDGGICVWEPF